MYVQGKCNILLLGILVISVKTSKKNQLGAQFFLVCLFLFCTCFGRLCAHHQEKQLYLCDAWYLLFCMDDCLVCALHNSHPYSTVSVQYYSVFFFPVK